MTLALANEGARILEEGIAQRASDIDVVYCHGYGFPRFRGGPMHAAEARGLHVVAERIAHFQQTLNPDNWALAPLLELSGLRVMAARSRMRRDHLRAIVTLRQPLNILNLKY